MRLTPSGCAAASTASRVRRPISTVISPGIEAISRSPSRIARSGTDEAKDAAGGPTAWILRPCGAVVDRQPVTLLVHVVLVVERAAVLLGSGEEREADRRLGGRRAAAGGRLPAEAHARPAPVERRLRAHVTPSLAPGVDHRIGLGAPYL